MLTTKNWRALLALLGLALMFVAALTGCTPPGPRALLEGERLIRAGKYPQAIDSLQEATRLLPSNAQAWNHLGLAYHKAGQPHNALKAYEQARRCDIHLTPVRYNLGCLLLEQNNLQPAIAELTAYTLLQSDSADGWLRLATAQLRARQWDAAERSFRKALQLRPNIPQAWNSLGMIQAQRKRTKEALNCFSAALQKQPAYAPAVLNSAIVYQHQAKNDQLALQKYEEYLRLRPEARDADLVKQIVRHLKAPPPARREDSVAAAAVRQNPPPSSDTPGSNNLAARNEPATPPATAPADSPRVSVRGPDSSSPRPTIAQASPPSEPRRESPSPTDAQPQPALARSGPVKFTPAPTVETTAPAPEPSRQTDPARTPATSTFTPPQEAAVVNPPSTPAPPSRTDVIQLTEDPPVKLAEDRSQPAAIPLPAPEPQRITPLPQETPPSETVVRTDPAGREPRNVLDRLNPANWFKPRRPTPPSPADLGATADSWSSAPSEAPAATAVVRPAPVEQTSWANIPRYVYRSLDKPAAGDRFKAQGSFTQAVEAHRDQRLTEAMASYQQAIAADPAFYEAQYNLGLAAYEAKDWALSLSAYETALSINPTSANCRYNFALALQQAGFYLDAADELEKLIAQQPGEARAHLTLASLYADELGKPLLARPHYVKVLELDPQHSQAPAIRYWLASNP